MAWRFKAFLRDVKGSTAIVFAAAAVVLFVSMGGAVDYAKMTAARTALQDASDAAALAAVRSEAKTEDEMLDIVKKYLSVSSAAQVVISGMNFKLTPGEKRVGELWVTGMSPNSFLELVGLNSFSFGVYSRVESGSTELELALVLDNTYSMTVTDAAGTSRMAALKSSSGMLIDTVMANPKSKVKVGLVPFVDYVNVGLDNRKASWMNVPDDYTVTGTPTCKTQQTTLYYNCVKQSATKVVDGVTVPYTYNKCDSKPGPPQTTCTTPVSTYKWNGCVGSRPSPNTLSPDIGAGPAFPGLLNVSCGQKLLPLSGDKTQVKSAIAAMTPINETYIPSGLLWGFGLLTPGEPFTQAGAFDPKNRNPHKAMVVMTDGVNTKSLKQPYHNGSNRTDADSMTKQSCDAIKAKNIEVFVVALDVTDVAAKTLLQYCATDSDHFYDAKGSGGLGTAFEAIAKSLQKLRLSA